MSYNIDSSEYKSGKLTIKRRDADRFLKKHGDDLPECTFLHYLPESDDDDAMLSIKDPWWYGEGSGRTYDDLLREVLAVTRGKATILFVWDGGDSHTALRVIDGVVSEAKVNISVE